jgi:threonine synthase
LRYVSTRGKAPELGFDEVLLAGLASDGGLYVPEEWPRLGADEIADFAGLSYTEIAVRVMTPYLGDTIAPIDFARMVGETYAGFGHGAVAPLRQIGDNDWLLELFHGPTLAFKDISLQLVGRLFDHVLEARGEGVTIIGATSGDTGSAAIEACRDKPNMEIFMLHPAGRVSEVQRRQMTTISSPNVFNIAIDGSFDDCQALVKAMFADEAFRGDFRLSAVNSINWARVMAQTVYYFAAAARLGAPERAVSFSVPTGNFGDIFSGYAAKRMGLPIEKLVIATNRNDILARFMATGSYQTGEVAPTLSPSMDIQISSNFERLLFELHDRSGSRVAALMGDLTSDGAFSVDVDHLYAARELFAACSLDDDETIEAIREVHRQTGVTVEPHTAIGIAAGRICREDPRTPVIALGTAHPAKFPDAVERATGERPALPGALADLLERPERVTPLPNELAAVQSFVRERSRGRDVGRGAA